MPILIVLRQQREYLQNKTYDFLPPECSVMYGRIFRLAVIHQRAALRSIIIGCILRHLLTSLPFDSLNEGDPCGDVAVCRPTCLSVCLSVCLCVCVSVALMYCVQTTELNIIQPSPDYSPTMLVSHTKYEPDSLRGSPH